MSAKKNAKKPKAKKEEAKAAEETAKSPQGDAQREVPTADPAAKVRPRLMKLVVRNFRCIGADPVEVDLDDIVVLVGPNNAGKSSVLRAYQVIMLEGSREGELALEDFPNGKITAGKTPEIELHTIVYDKGTGEEWIKKTGDGEYLVRERWTWPTPGAPIRRGYNVIEGRWAEEGDPELVPWGAANVANARRPQPHRVDAFESPDDQAEAIIGLLMTVLKERVTAYKDEAAEDDASDYAVLCKSIADVQKKIVKESRSQIATVEGELSQLVSRIFPKHKVVLDARPEDDVDKAISLFKAGAKLRMGPEGGHMSGIDRQGSGARRTLLWTAIKLIAESSLKKKPAKKKAKKKAAAGSECELERPHVLLLDEPEICLHPDAIREACSLLYGLPATGKWQVMVTTHSPCFVDVSRDNTTIVRVERNLTGRISGTTIFRPSVAQLDPEDKERLKLLNLFDPFVAEFFFGGRTIVVEGDTEYTAFRFLAEQSPEKYRGVHVVRARGKATVVSLAKILNHFGTDYAVLHDSDLPQAIRKGKSIANPAWSMNEKILATVGEAEGAVSLVASVPNFEKAYFDQEVLAGKPYNALQQVQDDVACRKNVENLLAYLVDGSTPLPENAISWRKIDQLEQKVKPFQK